MGRKQNPSETEPADGKSPPVKKIGPGRLPHQPTPANRTIVSMGMALNMTQEQIAERLGIDKKTLAKHYEQELAHGASDINMRVANNLLSIALQTQDRKASLTASIFWLKSKGGFNDRAGENGETVIEADGPVKVTLRLGTRLEDSAP